MSMIYLIISTLHNALLRDYVNENIDICDTNKIDLDTMDDISIFDLKEVLDDDKQIRSLAVTTNLVECIKNIMSESFARYHQIQNFEYEGILKYQEYLKLEYNQIRSDEGLGSLSNEAILDLSGLFISMVFITVQQNTIRKNEVDQYLMIKMIRPLDNLL
ncbi:30600_t:CDS:2 [Gigaspora margarita]|uniref:30600_t:CDS:1 n=1 Tax=Gigaspora margarita TaxID=4874 RepID=A0ABN7VP15_GIGMA|nr:30600_t:CDS:2 [Gigaspora margarita]